MLVLRQKLHNGMYDQQIIPVTFGEPWSPHWPLKVAVLEPPWLYCNMARDVSLLLYGRKVLAPARI